ncbi:L-seryl-tRNA(Sec) selenium transferase [Salsuginibacillus kocurii]|uniref:L-seryl-tRNA(Sec) selenium transferase n=1 Tax=Salsuginibacillus kocurii TaxID=427078 RepID=UPI00036A6D64|nr:L-seryl-tRNA(Sec) selenium transferase [Salsuginibacillus kocurii]
MSEIFKLLPPVHDLQAHSRFKALQTGDVTSARLTEWTRAELESLRQQVREHPNTFKKDRAHFTDVILTKLEERVAAWLSPHIHKVINATGTVLHTNLGRARLSESAVHAVTKAAKHYTDLEYDIETGERGSRHQIIEERVKEVTGAEAAMVVNNNAAAVYLVLKALAQDKAVAVSRGELVEIGGSFRVSSIMEESGASLVEVGTTNKTHLYDYKQAVENGAQMIMKVHTSNFVISGFTATVDSQELASLKEQDEGLIIYEDLGSGVLFDFSDEGIGKEPTVPDALAPGVDLVTFSGDKLLGGPQAGIIAGKKKWIDQLKKHQLARVLRVDKMTLAALDATLKMYAGSKELIEQLPVVRDVVASVEDIERKAAYFMKHFSTKWKMELLDGFSQVGGGTMPEVSLPTKLVQVIPPDQKIEKFSTWLRKKGEPCIITRRNEEGLSLDFRTVTVEEIEEIILRFQTYENELRHQAE